jgi:hypothetical protein
VNRLLVLGGPHIPPTGVRALVAIVEDVELIPAHRRDFTRTLGGEEDQQKPVRDQVMTVHRLRIEHAD